MIVTAVREVLLRNAKIPLTLNCSCYATRHKHFRSLQPQYGLSSKSGRGPQSDILDIEPRKLRHITLGKYSTDNKYDISNKFATDEVENVEPEKYVKKPASYFGSLLHFWRAPAPVLLTGLAGLVPFIAAPTYIYCLASSFHPFIISAQLAYGAVILSFVGGLRWGFVVPFRQGSTELVTWESIIQSTVPALIAWSGLMLPDLSGGLIVVSMGLILALYNDLRMFGDYPKWMMGLRCLLTTIAVLTLIASVILVEENRIKSIFGGRLQNKLLDKDT